MARDVLPEFQKYLLSRQLVPEKNVSFYARWVIKFLGFSNIHGSQSLISGNVQEYLSHLGIKQRVSLSNFSPSI